ncbi:MAG: AMP-binding protein [Proteobacteria bacterium]|nr:AMP-binding protein [Pseudomonadota bacterium]
MSNGPLLLEAFYALADAKPDKVLFTQPTGGGATVDYTRGEVLDRALRMSAHISSLGLEPGTRIAMASKNCAHFIITELAIWMAGCTTVALYPTANTDTVSYVIEHSDAKLLFVGKLDTWESEIKAAVPEGMPMIKLPLSPAGVDCPSFDEIIAKTEPPAERPTRDGDDTALFIYTSGSTGRPKGVMHGFKQMSFVAHGVVEALEITENDRSLSYLPLAHVFERAYLECTLLVAGSHLFFAESLDTFQKDLQRAAPTLFISVPRLWLKFQLGVFKKMPPKKLDLFLKIPILSGIVKKKLLTALGLQDVRLAGSGSAPIPGELIAWYRRLGLNLLEGYAMSEDFAFSHLSTLQHNEPGYVGVPYPGVEVKLSDAGEILIKSPGAMQGYYKQEELTKDCYTEDGYFKTGDRGERKPSGLLKITGRVKEIFKTSKGKYVAPAPIENIINNSPIVELSCVSGSGQPAAYSLVVLAEELRPKMKDAGFRDEYGPQLEELLAEVNRKVEHHETLHCLVIVDGGWEISNDFLTPTMKIKRTTIEDAYEANVDGWYAQGAKVVWA